MAMQPELSLPASPGTDLDRPSRPPPEQQLLVRPAEMYRPPPPVDTTTSPLVLYCPPAHLTFSSNPFTEEGGTRSRLALACDSSGSATNLVGAEPYWVSLVPVLFCNLLVHMEFLADSRLQIVFKISLCISLNVLYQQNMVS